ncbi:MAG TPA: tetratricopeptide repeat protein [Leucothrix mucor]|uniref:Tetratricopeptide repeat protein n=1 Tax=Leucothrix mucor TaxID=45248 RepID=A0A7V2WUC9_LEUMU|nr:tetratricopeptide repeat protein [Leucothrix mucor]
MSSTKKSNISWLSGFLAILLIVAVVAIVWVSLDITSTIPEKKTTATPSVVVNIGSLNELAHQLVDKFAADNLLLKERNNILQAVNNSLQHLQDTHNNQVLFALQKLDLDTATTYLSASVKHEKLPRDAAKIWVDIGNLHQLKSSQLALFAYKKASKLDDHNSNAWNRLGNYYRQQKKFSLAENAYEKVLQSSVEGSATKAVALANFGLLYQAQGKLEQAKESYKSAIKINAIKKNTASLASNNENIAILYKKNHNFEASEKHYLEALSHYETLEQDSSVANIQLSLASLYHQQKKLDQAKQYYQIAIERYKQNNNQRKIASSYSNLGILSQQQNKIAEAKDFFEKSLVLNQQIKQQKGIADQYGNLGVLYRLQKKFIASETSHLKSLQIYQQLQQSDAVSQQQTNLGFLYQAWKKTEKACQYWQESKQTLMQLNNTSRVIRIKNIVQKYCEPKKLDGKKAAS